MGKQVVLRPVFQRPEMLQLSLEYEIKARNYFDIGDDLTTVFLVEHGAPQEIFDVIKKYPFKYEVIAREKRYGSTINTLEGMKYAFAKSDDFIIYIEEDLLVHKTYMQYMYCLIHHKDLDKFSILVSSSGRDEDGDVNEIYFANRHSNLCPVISKWYFEKYIFEHCRPEYYNNRHNYVLNLDKKYINEMLYKLKDGLFNEQDGLLNRISDIAYLSEGILSARPRVRRQTHIGFYGANRAGSLPGNSFDERLSNLKEIITSPDKMYECAKSKEYNDYRVFNEEKLTFWDGTLTLGGSHLIERVR